MNTIVKMEVNTLARGFYKMLGYEVPEGYDFSKATHPTEKLMWKQASLSYEFWYVSLTKRRK